MILNKSNKSALFRIRKTINAIYYTIHLSLNRKTYFVIKARRQLAPDIDLISFYAEHLRANKIANNFVLYRISPNEAKSELKRLENKEINYPYDKHFNINYHGLEYIKNYDKKWDLSYYLA